MVSYANKVSRGHSTHFVDLSKVVQLVNTVVLLEHSISNYE